jgi:hypothetical protein
VNWKEHEAKALCEWMTLFDREVEPIGRNNSQCGTVRVIK